MSDTERFEILSDCIDSGFPVEAYSIEEQKSRLVLANESLVEPTKTAMQESVSWLPFFAELYNISANLKDYILVPVAIMPSDLPNRNAQAFPYEELVRADSETGQIGFETWSRKPTFKDHKNKLGQDPAKGIILSSTMLPMRKVKGNIWKVMCLCAYDRKADPILANDILTGKRPSYSMGAWSRYFTCSVCSAVHTTRESGCDHISTKTLRMSRVPGPSADRDKLAYLQARYINGFECSSVEKPAYAIATTPTEYHLR